MATNGSFVVAFPLKEQAGEWLPAIFETPSASLGCSMG